MEGIKVSEREAFEAVLFVRHIRKHLREGQEPKCPVCHKKLGDIFSVEQRKLAEAPEPASEPALAQEKPWVQMKKEPSMLDPTCVIFTLFDPNFKCLLDRWEVRSPVEHKEMLEDFYALGLITFEQLMSAPSAPQPGLIRRG